MAKITTITPVTSDLVTDDATMFISKDGSSTLYSIKVSELGMVLRSQLDSFPEDSWLVSEIKSKAADDSNPFVAIEEDDCTESDIVNALLEFIDCIKRDETDFGFLINQLKSYISTINLSDITDLTSAAEVFTGLVNIFKYSVDVGYATVTIKASRGLVNLSSISDISVFQDAISFVISRFSGKNVEIDSYVQVLDGNG